MTGTEPEDHQVEVGSDAVAGLASLLPVGAFATDGAGRCTYVSDRWCQLSGLDANRALGRGWIAAVHADDRAAVGRAWQRFVAGEGPFTTEFRFVGDDGQGRWVRALARATRDDAGHLTRCVGTVTEITDQRAALARLAQLTERLSDMVVVIDRDGIIRWANGATKRVLGYERATKYGTPIFDLVHPDDLPRTVDGLARFTRDEHTQTGINLRVRCADDSWRRVEVMSSNFLDEPWLRGIVLVARDLTDRHALQRRVHELEHSFTAAFRHSPVGRGVADLNGRWVQVNAALAEMIGQDPVDLVGAPGIESVDPAQRDQVWAEFRSLGAGAVDRVTVDVCFRRLDGAPRWGHFTTWVVVDDDGKPMHYAADVTDVTEVRAAREAEERNRREYEALIEQSSDIISILEPDGAFRASSAASTRMLGYERGYMPPGGIVSLLHPDDVDAAVRAFREIGRGDGGPSEPLVVRVRAADGTYRHLETVAHDRSNDEDVRGIVLNSRDITERVQAEETARAAEGRLRALLEHSSDVIVLMDANGHIVYVSPANERIFGRAHDEVQGSYGLFAIHPDDRPRVIDALQRVLSQPEGRVEVNLRVRHADGTYRHVEAVAQSRVYDPLVRGVVWNIRDITSRLEAIAELHEAQARFAALVHHASDLISVNRLDGVLTYVSPSASGVLGYAPGELVGTQARALMHPDDVDRVERTAFEQFARGVVEPIEYRARRSDGSWRVVEAIMTNLLDEPAVEGIVTNARDVTDRRVAERRAFELVEILEATNEIVVMSDPNGRVVYANRSARSLLDVHEEQHVGALSSETSRERLRTEIMPLVRRRGSWSGELEFVDPHANVIPVAATVQAHHDELGAVVRIATVAHDITDLKAAQRRLEFDATHDTLTGLANRALFREIGERALASSRRTEDPVAVLFLDLDGFKLVNDTYGHDAGDVLLALVARRVVEAIRAGDVLARLGGDEFVILCERPRSEHQMLELADRIIETVSQPFTIDGHEVRVGLSIGIAFSHPNGAGITELIRDADVALYRAKHEGRGRAWLFDESLLG
jgi:diguanylate cyclase (GGDEF)-like protein/PAS domain S-box-containing protein